jgi:hypothetical protein
MSSENKIDCQLRKYKILKNTKTMPTQNQLERSERGRKYAWAQYFNAQRENHNDTIEQVNTLEHSVPTMIQNELKEYYDKLKTKIECPICLETIPTNRLDWSKCGHKYCKECLITLKRQTNPKCAMCRVKL